MTAQTCSKCSGTLFVEDQPGIWICKNCRDTEKQPLLEILKNPELLNIIDAELDKQIVNEKKARKVIFLSANGRLVKNCQVASYNVLVNDEAGKGKDFVTGHVLKILPSEVFIHKTRISPTVFTYWHNAQYEPDWTWNGKVFYPEDISETVLNSDVFKVMCSGGSSATMVIKQRAVDITIKGKPVMVTTTASATPNPELTRRFIILNLDSSKDQTREIMKRHAEAAATGKSNEYDINVIKCQTLLRRVEVNIPFAKDLFQYFPDDSVIMRTNFPRFLDYIRASAALHQYQREKDGDVVLADWKDYDIAREVFHTICSNRSMIPLTLNQKNILAVFQNEPHFKASASQLLPFLKGIVNTIDTCQKHLRLLCSYGLLREFIDKDSLNRDISVFTATDALSQKEFTLPESKEICRITEVSEVTRINEITRITRITNNDNTDTNGDTRDTRVITVQNATNDDDFIEVGGQK